MARVEMGPFLNKIIEKAPKIWRDHIMPQKKREVRDYSEAITRDFVQEEPDLDASFKRYLRKIDTTEFTQDLNTTKLHPRMVNISGEEEN